MLVKDWPKRREAPGLWVKLAQTPKNLQSKREKFNFL